MKKFLKKLQWWVDYHLTIFLYNGMKYKRYIHYMESRYGEHWYIPPA